MSIDHIIPVRVICHVIFLTLPTSISYTLFFSLSEIYTYVLRKVQFANEFLRRKDCLNCSLNLSWICLRVAYPRSRSN